MNCKKQMRSALSLLCAAAMLCGCAPQEESSVKEADTESSVAEETTTESTTTATEATTTTTEATTTATTTTTQPPSKVERKNPTIAQGLSFGMTEEEVFAVLGEDYFYETDGYTWATGEELPNHYYEYELDGISRLGVEMETVLTVELTENGYLYNVCYHIGRIPAGLDDTYGYAISDHPYNADELTDVYNALLPKLTTWFGEGTQRNEYGSYIDEYEWTDTDCGDLWFMVSTDTWDMEGYNQIWLSSIDASWLDVTEVPDSGITTDDTFVMTLYPDVAPITCANFEQLVSSGFYDGLTFHRVVDDFVAQGGDPNGDGTGGSDETIKGEFSANGVENALSHQRGIVSMARASAMDSATSQFFICYTDCSFLDGNYAAFGEITEGMDVIDSFLTVERTYGSDGALSFPLSPIVITSAVMIEDDIDGNPRALFTINITPAAE